MSLKILEFLWFHTGKTVKDSCPPADLHHLPPQAMSHPARYSMCAVCGHPGSHVSAQSIPIKQLSLEDTLVLYSTHRKTGWGEVCAAPGRGYKVIWAEGARNSKHVLKGEQARSKHTPLETQTLRLVKKVMAKGRAELSRAGTPFTRV